MSIMTKTIIQRHLQPQITFFSSCFFFLALFLMLKRINCALLQDNARTYRYGQNIFSVLQRFRTVASRFTRKLGSGQRVGQGFFKTGHGPPGPPSLRFWRRHRSRFLTRFLYLQQNIMSRPMLYYDDEDEDGSPDSVGYIEEDHPLQMHGNRELAAQAVKLLQVPDRSGDTSFAASTTDMDVPIYVRGSASSRSAGNKVTTCSVAIFLEKRLRVFCLDKSSQVIRIILLVEKKKRPVNITTNLSR